MRVIKSLILLIALNAVLLVNGQSVDPSTTYNSFQISGGANNVCDPSGQGSATAVLNVDTVGSCVQGCGGSVKVNSATNKNDFTFQPYTDNACAQASGSPLPFTCSDSNENAIGTSTYKVRCGTSTTETTEPAVTTQPPATTQPAATTQPPATTPAATTPVPTTPAPSDSSAYSLTASVSLIIFSIAASFL